MATRYYPTTRPPEVVIPGPLRGDWDSNQATDFESGRVTRSPWDWVFLLSTSKTNGGTRRTMSLPQTKTVPEDVEFMRWITPPLAAQTLGGTLQVCFRVNTTAGVTAGYHVHVYVTVGNTTAIRGVALTDYVEASGWTTTATFRSFTAPQALAAIGIQAGDRIVVEVGARLTVSGVSATQFSMAYGTTDTSNVAGVDAVAGNTSAALVGWVEFSGTITEAVSLSTNPVNNSCATAAVVGDLPYVAGPLDTTAASGTDREVWYQWTAPFSDYVLIHTLGSTYKTLMTIWTGVCGAQVRVFPVTDDAARGWIGRSQATQMFFADQGVTYYFRIYTNTVSGTPNAVEQANLCGGSLTFSMTRYLTPVSGDLIVDCQHVVAIHDGVIVNMAQQFFGSTPTGSAIDYTLRPIEDFNAPGVPNTQERVYITQFGSTPIVEVVDLPALNVGYGAGDMNFMFDALDDGGENLASVVFDGSGRLIFGYFGDNYSVHGTVPSVAASGWVRRVDAVTGLDSPGPAELATQFQVAFENSGSDYVEVTSDGNTLFYTSAGRLIKRFDLAGNAQLPDFATLPVQVGVTRPGARGLRLLPPGDGTGGLLVCYGDEVLRVDGSGTVVQSYRPAATERAQDLDKVEIMPDGQSFWVSDQLTASLFQFDLSSGAELDDIETELPIGQLSGFSIYHGYRAGVSEPPTPPLPEGCPPSNMEPRSVQGLDGCPATL